MDGAMLCPLCVRPRVLEPTGDDKAQRAECGMGHRVSRRNNDPARWETYNPFQPEGWTSWTA